MMSLVNIAAKRSGRWEPRGGNSKVIDDLYTSSLNEMNGKD